MTRYTTQPAHAERAAIDQFLRWGLVVTLVLCRCQEKEEQMPACWRCPNWGRGCWSKCRLPLTPLTRRYNYEKQSL